MSPFAPPGQLRKLSDLASISKQKNIPAQTKHRYNKTISARRDSGLLEQNHAPKPGLRGFTNEKSTFPAG
jgi:hypothetical protein